MKLLYYGPAKTNENCDAKCGHEADNACIKQVWTPSVPHTNEYQNEHERFAIKHEPIL